MGVFLEQVLRDPIEAECDSCGLCGAVLTCTRLREVLLVIVLSVVKFWRRNDLGGNGRFSLRS